MKLRESVDISYRQASQDRDAMRSLRGLRCAGQRLRLCVLILIVCPWLATSILHAEVVLFKNGNTLEGTVRKDRGRWQIELPSGGVVTVARDTVDFIGPDLSAAYRHLRARLPNREGAQVARLVSWGLQHQLVHDVRPDLETLTQLDNGRGTWQHLQQRWTQMVQMSSPANGPEKTQFPVTPAAWVQPAEAIEAEPAVLAGDRGELLSTAELQAFSKQAYPILQARCSGAGCHSDGPANTERRFRLLDRHWGVTAMRRSAASTYEFLNLEEPSKSPLLDFARRAHGTRKEVPLPAHERRVWVKLEAWVQQASELQRSAVTQVAKEQVASASAAAAAPDPLDPAGFNRLAPPIPASPVEAPARSADQVATEPGPLAEDLQDAGPPP